MARKRSSRRHFKLSIPLADALALHCMARGEDPADVVADLVALYLDEEMGPVPDVDPVLAAARYGEASFLPAALS